MKLYILRHGETIWNVERRLQGCADIPLNENGIELAKVTGEALKDIPFDFAITSPLKRAKTTAQLVLGKREIPLYEDARLQEIGFGEWEGLCCSKDNYEIPSKEFENFFTNPFSYHPPKGGESLKDVCNRTKALLDELQNNKKLEDKNILLSSHGGTVRALLHHVYTDNQDFWRGQVPPNCSINIVEILNGRAVLLEEDIIYYDESRIVKYV